MNDRVEEEFPTLTPLPTPEMDLVFELYCAQAEEAARHNTRDINNM